MSDTVVPPTDAERNPGTRHPATTLRLVRVEYPDRPDRWTICPRDLSESELLVSWLTADDSAFIDIAECR